MADSITSSQTLKLEATFADGNKTVITLANGEPSVTTAQIAELDTLEDRVAQINTDNFVSVEEFEDKLNNRLEELADQTNDTFTAEDVEDVFS